jgi:hypothetical protein
MVVFIDEKSWPCGSPSDEVADILSGHKDVTYYHWPMGGATYEADKSIGKFGDAQRYKMLAGFVFVPSMFVQTKYWLKLDLDVVATGVDDWIDPDWFEEAPAIVAHPWGYTKPANQMIQLDEWARGKFASNELQLRPSKGSNKIRHKRIISWCGFFHTKFTRIAADYASCGPYKLPVPSQDGYLWYCAKRLGLSIVRTNMKSRGWSWQSGNKRVEHAAVEAMRDELE